DRVGGGARRAVGGAVHADEGGHLVEVVRPGDADVAGADGAGVDRRVVLVGDRERVAGAAGGGDGGGRRPPHGGGERPALGGAAVRGRTGHPGGEAALVAGEAGRVGAFVDRRAASAQGVGHRQPAVVGERPEVQVGPERQVVGAGGGQHAGAR